MNSHIAFDLAREPAWELAAQVAIKLEGVAVRYLAPQERLRTFKEYAIRRLQQRVRFTDFYALKDIDLEVERGEIFGIIGRNGAGKSTLLKVMSRVLVPTRGRVRLRGLVAPLLELGAGFHPELTGRENVMLNGTILGHSARELQEQIDAIIDFAGLGSFIEAPVRTYSSGMSARLGFAVATAWRPEILLVDEVLAVGDQAFTRKCEDRMEEFRARGTTTVLVTHSMDRIRELCTRAAWIERGRIAELGPVDEVVNRYLAAALPPA